MFPKHASFLLALLVALLFGVGVAHAGEGGGPFAFSLSQFLSSFANRSRVIQVAAVGMALALLIILKQFDHPRS